MEFGNNQPPKSNDDNVINISDHLKNMPSPQNLAKAVIGTIILAIVFFGVMGSFYKVGTDETAVILRLGKFSSLVPSGLHFKIPFGVDKHLLVKTGRVLKEEFGFRSQNPGIRSTFARQGFENESLMLSGDLNVTDLKWIVQYQIADPFKFIFNIKQPIIAIRDLSEATVRKVVGDSHVTDILTTERSSLAAIAQRDLQKILNSEEYDIGVRILTVKFQDVNPPETVKPAFNEVNEAEQQKESLINQAEGQYNKEVPRARGEAKRLIQEAEGYALQRINRAYGETARFVALLGEYRQNPEVTRQRLYLETMEQVLPKLKETYVLDGNKSGNSVFPLLPLNNFGSTGVEGGRK